ncbi:MAG: DoxX family protein [Dehalococcoidia bacterium]
MKILEEFNNVGRTMVTPHVSLLLLRVAMGVLFLKAGLDKLFAEDGWSASGYLLNATYGPFKGFFEGMAGSPLVDGLVMYGLILIGVALLLGAATRWTALMGSLLVLLFYLTQLPPEHGFVSDRMIYILALNLLAVARAGTYFGIDGLLERTEEKYPPLKYVLG